MTSGGHSFQLNFILVSAYLKLIIQRGHQTHLPDIIFIKSSRSGKSTGFGIIQSCVYVPFTSYRTVNKSLNIL